MDVQAEAGSGRRPDRRALVEIRAVRDVADVAEAELFAAEVFRALARLGEQRGWRIRLDTVEEGTARGLRVAALEIDGSGGRAPAI